MRQLERLCLIGSLTVAMALGASAAGFAQLGGATTGVSGRGEYDYTCAQCHGPGGRGDGVMVHYLKYKPTDLTALARNNHGVFPEKQIRAIIDGTKVVGAHGESGAREMPVWGREFLKQGSSPEQAQARISALVGYIKSIQEK
jgi:mono/diheme cytochrome c family protein